MTAPGPSGTSAVHSAELDDGVLVGGDDVVPVPAAVHERLERQVEGELARRALDADAESTRCERPLAIELVDDDRRAPALQADGEPDVVDDRVAPPVAAGKALK